MYPIIAHFFLCSRCCVFKGGERSDLHPPPVVVIPTFLSHFVSTITTQRFPARLSQHSIQYTMSNDNVSNNDGDCLVQEAVVASRPERNVQRKLETVPRERQVHR
jgi:hypothetical protein